MTQLAFSVERPMPYPAVLRYTQPPMPELRAHEYRALRDAITARTHLRASLALAGVAGWAAALTAVLIAIPVPVAAALPLMVLVATFEVIRALHFGAERVGRYLQVFHEEGPGTGGGRLDAPAWERAAMQFGPAMPGAAGHPLFVPVFALATVVNGLAVLLPGPLRIEVASMAVPHVAFLAWLFRADRAMRGQRATELARFRALRDAKDPTVPP